MFNKKPQLSRSSFIVILMCLLVLLTIFVLSYFNLKQISTLQSTVDELSKEDTSIVLLRKCNEELMIAENHYRIYINSADSVKKEIFLGDISNVISYCSQLAGFDSSFSEKIQRDANYKVILYDAIKKLKNLFDAVSNKPARTFTIVSFNGPIRLERMNKSFFKNYFSNSTDTIKLLQDKKKMGFFQKLSYLFSNREATEIKKELIKGSPAEKKYIDSIQHETDSTIHSLTGQVKNYYQKSVNKQLALRQQLSAKETNLAESNLIMISEIDSKINDLIAKKEETNNQRNADMLTKAVSARSSIQTITFFSLLGILVLIALLVYNIYRTNKYEEAILEAKTNAEKLAFLKSRFLSNMSHEIRSPLTAIMGFAEQVANNEKSVNNVKYLNAIEVSSRHLLNTVNDILDFSKLDAGKLVLNKQPFHLKKSIDEVALAFSLEADKKRIALHVNTDFDETCTVNGDAYRFKQILFNLVSNAIKFTDRGRIDINGSAIQTDEKNCLTTIAVKDSGIGIKPSQFNMIFQEFAQASVSDNNEHARAVKGTGLGLPISKMLAELQNGSITVESEPGKGSVFTLKIPYERVTPEKLKPPAASPILQPASLSKKSGTSILLVEDNELNIMLISILLERMGFRFDVATDGEMALQYHQKNNYSLILTDINIPKLTGVQLTEQIRKQSDAARSKIKIVALTATILDDDFDAYYKAGINKILVKPFTEEEFRHVVENFVMEREGAGDKS
jgi:signal transduction histidine kinase/CheY-like chemotaxis protein